MPASVKKNAVALLVAEESDLNAARRFFGDEKSDWLLAKVSDKTFSANVISLDGVEKYIVVWHKNANGHLFINCAIEKNGGGDLDGLVSGIKQLARQSACSGIAFNTKRKGLFAEMEKRGFEFHGVAMTMLF